MDETRSPAEGAATTATDTEQLRADVASLLEDFQEWVYDDNPPHSYCPSCLWDSRKGPWPMPNRQGLGHHEGCKMEAVLDRLRAFVGQ